MVRTPASWSGNLSHPSLPGCLCFVDHTYTTYKHVCQHVSWPNSKCDSRPTCSNTPALGSTSSVHICRSSLRGEMDPEFNEAKIPAFATKGRSQIYKGFPNQAISNCYPGFYCYCVFLDQLLRFGNGITPYLQLQIVLCQDGVSLRHSAIDGQNAAPGGWHKHWSIHNLHRIKSWNSTSPSAATHHSPYIFWTVGCRAFFFAISSKSSCAGSARPRPIRPWKFDGILGSKKKMGLVNSSPTELRD